MIKALFAVDDYGGMGNQGSLPWPKNTDDLANFKSLTTGHVVVMGRKSWDDPNLPKPLQGRTVYVASNRRVFYAGRISGDIKEQVLALEQKHKDQIIWVVGGPDIIMACQSILDEQVITHIKGKHYADTRIQIDSVLRGFRPIRSRTFSDLTSIQVTYEPIFTRSQDNS